MIVPEKRLITVTACLLLPVALLTAFVAATDFILELFAAGLALLTAIDATLAYIHRKGVTAEFPERLDLARDREEELRFDLVNVSGRTKELILGLQFPPGVGSSRDSFRCELPEGRKLHVTWAITASMRGVHQLGPCHFRLLSPLGFWTWQGSLPVRTQLHVYPDLLSARKKLAAMLSNRHEMPIHVRRQVGQGREFEKLRPYVAGDSLADISWKGTARRGQLITKQYQIERTQEVYVVIDSSRLSSRRIMEPQAGTGAGDHLLEQYITAALVLGMVAQRQGDFFGLMAFSDRVNSFVRANAGKKHFGACRDALYRVHPHMVTPDFEEMASFLGTRLRKRALILVLTNLDEPALAEDFVRSINVLNRRHLVLVSMLSPTGANPLFSGHEIASSEEMYGALGGHLLWQSLRELREVLRQRGVEFSLLDSGRLFADLVSRYIDIKRRQVL